MNIELAWWGWVLIALLAVVLVATAAFVAWITRQHMTAAEGASELAAIGIDVARLPGRLRRLAADPRVPRSVRWKLIGLAIYIASPIDPIPDFLPGIGHLDEVVLVPLILRHIRRSIPDDVWLEYVPPRPRQSGRRPAP